MGRSDPLAGVDKDIKGKLLVARRQGCYLAKTANGHIYVENPATNKSTTVGGNGSSYRGPANVQADLEAIEVKFPRTPKRGKGKRRKTTGTATSDIQPPEDNTPMPPLNESTTDTQAAVERIIKDPSSGDYLLEAIRDEVRKTQQGQHRRQRHRHGRAGVEWEGQLYGLASKYWDDLPTDPQGAEAAALHREVVKPLMDEGRLDLVKMLRDGFAVWWVYDESAPAIPAIPDEPAAEPVQASPPTPSPPTYPKRSGNAVRYEQCGYCPYVGPHMAVLTHRRRTELVDGEHPVERVIACKDHGPDPHCLFVLTSPGAFRQHMTTLHGKSGQFMCTECLRFFPSKGMQMAHSREVHDGGKVGRKGAGVKPTTAHRASAHKPLKAAAQPEVKPNGHSDAGPSELSRADQAGLFMDILAEHRAWAAKMPALTAENEDLRAENRALRARLRKIARDADL
jgi:hypothetical protein